MGPLGVGNFAPQYLASNRVLQSEFVSLLIFSWLPDYASSPQVLKPRGNSQDDSMTAFGCISEVGVALGHGGRSSLLPLVGVAVETH